MHKILVLGLGNDLLTDDAVGLRVVAEVRRRLGDDPNIAVKSTHEAGPAILDQIVGYESLVVVDSIQTGKSRPGHIHVLEPQRLRTPCTRWPHALGLEETCALGSSLGLEVPRLLRIIAIEVADPFTIGTDMTPAVEKAIEPAVDRVLACARKLAEPLGEAHPSKAP